MQRVTLEELEVKIERINDLLKNINLKLAGRYGYWAIDYTNKEGIMKGTLVAGLSRREVKDILDAIERLLREEEGYSFG
jgi:hypothetical protein